MKMKLALLFYSLLLLVSCGVQDDTVLQLQEKNTLLEAKNDSLLHVIEQLKRSPNEVVLSAKQLMAAGKKDSAIQMLRDLSRRSLMASDAAKVVRLLKQPKKKEKGTKKVSPATEPSEVTDEEASLYSPKGKEKDLRNDDKVEHNWSVETTTPVVKRPAKEKTYSVRIGAICRDGTRSSATGRGACSHHGGVSEWVYE